MANLTFTQIEDLWKQAGGDPVYAVMAAAIAMAESGGNPDATHTNSNGTVDRGVWQINSIHGSQSTTDPLANARAAVSISSNGTNWRPWCTAWSNGACGGTYLGSGSPYQKFTTGDAASPSGGGGAGGGQQTTGFGLNPLSWPAELSQDLAKQFLGPIGRWLWYGGMASAGILLMMIGAFLLAREAFLSTRTGQTLHSAAMAGATRGLYTGTRRTVSRGVSRRGSNSGSKSVPGVRRTEPDTRTRDTGRRPVRTGSSEGIDRVRQRRTEASIRRRAARERARNDTGGGRHRAET